SRRSSRPPAATMRHSASGRLRERIASAEAAIRPAWAAHAMVVLGAALDGQPDHVRRAVERRIRELAARKADDPAWHADPVLAVVRAVAEASPEIGRVVATKLNIQLQ